MIHRIVFYVDDKMKISIFQSTHQKIVLVDGLLINYDTPTDFIYLKEIY